MLPKHSKNKLSTSTSKKQRGQILVGMLIAIGVFAILAHALFTLIASSYNLINQNRSRITARHLAQEKIEEIRNLAYADVGTQGGVPSGNLTQEEQVRKNGLNYTRKTTIVFIDDPFDQLAPSDTNPSDYKRVRVEVSWEGLAASGNNPVVIITDIAPTFEQASSGGTLTVLVYDANGSPVSQADVVIYAPTSPEVNTTQQTDANGEVTLPGSPACIECYEISVTKTGFSSERTYSTSEVTNPIKPHGSIFEGDVTQISFTIDTVGSIDISTVDSRENNFTPLGGINFRIRGNKIIGTDAFAQPVYKYDQSQTTDGSGNILLSDMEWDSYHITMPTGTLYDISGTDPLLPLYLEPAEDEIFTFSVEPHTDHSFFVTIKDPSQNRIASASARLYNNQFDEESFTGETDNPDEGQYLFTSLEEDIYTFEATASGFLDFSGDYTISGYTTAEIVLTPN